MAKERLITAQATPEDATLSASLRPRRLDDYVGQPRLIEKLRITLEAVQQRGEAMEHVLLHGPPGLGKTTLSHIIAQEMGTHLSVTSGPAIAKPGDLVGTLTRLQHADVLFIDEIHRLPVAVEEHLYSAMEDFKIDVTVDAGMHARTYTMPVQPFCLIGATTRAGLLSGPMRSRFGITHNLEFYGEEDLTAILRRSARLLEIPGADPETTASDESMARALDQSLRAIASRSRGTPRIANRLLRRVRDYAQVKADGSLGLALVDQALGLEGVDELGLDELDRRYLRTIGTTYEGGPVGLEAIAATLGEDAGTLEDIVEPYLLQRGLLARTRKGRMLTSEGADRAGVPRPSRADADAGAGRSGVSGGDDTDGELFDANH